jgi:TPR repeat protein
LVRFFVLVLISPIISDVKTIGSLDPLRIAAVPGVTLDVVITGQSVHPESILLQGAAPKTLPKEISLESLQYSLPNSSQEHSSASSNNSVSNNNASNTIRRNPAYGLVEEALENYNHIENPATAPARRGPQLIPNDQSSAQDEHDDPSKPQHSPNKIQQQARSPQGTASGITRDFAQTLMKATLGDKDAQVAVGDMYKDGQGVAQDYQAAMDWYLKAAEQDDPVGQRKVGVLYDHGLGVTQNYSTAMEWYLLAAEQGSPPAQRNIANLYRAGRGVPQDDSKAMEWYLKAADQGNAAAQQSIG